MSQHAEFVSGNRVEIWGHKPYFVGSGTEDPVNFFISPMVDPLAF